MSTQIKTALSARRAKARDEVKRHGREIVKRFPCGDGMSVGRLPGGPAGKLEMATARNGELLILRDGVIIGTRGPMCWITEEAGTGIFDTDDRTGIELVYNVEGPDGDPLPIGAECRNRIAEAVFEKQQERPTLN